MERTVLLTSMHLGKGREGGDGMGCHIQAFLDSVHFISWFEAVFCTIYPFGTQYILCFSRSRRSGGESHTWELGRGIFPY